MRLLRLIFAPLTLLLRLLLRPLRLRRRARLLHPHGWIELHLEGEVLEHRPVEPRGQRWVRRLLRREAPRRVVLARLRKLVDELLTDPHLKGVLIQIGPLQGGWASAESIRKELLRLKEKKVPLLVHLKSHAGNRELLVAAAGTELWMTPPGAWAAIGSAAQGLYLKDLLERFGVTIEVAHRGRFKSAPDRFTRNDRSEPDREQTQALIDALDEALLTALAEHYGTDRSDAEAKVDRAPLVGSHALTEGHVRALVRDEDLTEKVATFAQITTDKKHPFRPVGAGGYLDRRRLPPLWARRQKHLGIVEVHGAIVDQAPAGPLGGGGRSAIEGVVVADLRAALADPSIGAVILHVDSRGGSVTASDGIYAAVKRLAAEKVVIACFGDVAASGGYYVACGAKEIVASPLTVTGSIGVFGMIPTWPLVAERYAVHHDVLKNRRHAAIYDPWRGFDDEARALADREVGAMYEDFLALVGAARKMTRDQVDAVAQGRVWTGRAAQQVGLVDGLGGMPEAIERAKKAYGKPLAEDVVLIKARGPVPRPGPRPAEEATPKAELGVAAAWLQTLVGDASDLTILTELSWLLAGAPRRPTHLAYLPLRWD